MKVGASICEGVTRLHSKDTRAKRIQKDWKKLGKAGFSPPGHNKLLFQQISGEYTFERRLNKKSDSQEADGMV